MSELDEQLDAQWDVFRQGVKHGQRIEREAIVAWLNDPRNSRYLAERIESGDHLGATNE